MAVQPGSVLNGRYQVMRVLGEGGMARVYEAQDLSSARRCAIKEMEDSFQDEELRACAITQFRGEITLLLGLSHPNIPRVTDYFSHQASYFMVMDFIEGKDLDKLLKERGAPFPEKTIMQWGIELCRVLFYLHIQKPPVIFRDLKPSNIILSARGTLVLVDFGIARIFKAHKRGDTFHMGTEGYAAPEQYLENRQSDGRTDIYALGATLYHLATGQSPLFQFPHLRDLSPDIAAILRKATDLDPDDRFSSAKEMRIALEKACGISPDRRRPAIAMAAPSSTSTDKTSYMIERSSPKEAVKYCDKCGAQIRAKSRFCNRCGARA
ncbi:MAG: protein kinase [Candidatus Eremiobacteraeota bacterium]|nr:protein kinase [Candidatus Eremiobacteraeota bacterium]